MNDDELWLELAFAVRELARAFEEHTHCLDRNSTFGPRGYRKGRFSERIEGLIERFPESRRQAAASRPAPEGRPDAD